MPDNLTQICMKKIFLFYTINVFIMNYNACAGIILFLCEQIGICVNKSVK